jgi:hypothetical protein
VSPNEIASAAIVLLALLTIAAIVARAYRLPADPDAGKFPIRSLREDRFHFTAWVLVPGNPEGGKEEKPEGGALWFWVGDTTKAGALRRARHFRTAIEEEIEAEEIRLGRR